MSVITNKHDDEFNYVVGQNAERCSICKGSLYYPFLHWQAKEDPDVFFCGRCCAKNGDGLMADIIQVAAIAELQRLGVMRGYTLVRKNVKTLEKEGAKEQEEIAKCMREHLPQNNLKMLKK